MRIFSELSEAMDYDLDHLILEMATLLTSDDPDHGTEAARQLRTFSMENRSEPECCTAVDTYGHFWPALCCCVNL